MKPLRRPSTRRAAVLAAALVSLSLPLLALTPPASARTASTAAPALTSAVVCNDPAGTDCWLFKGGTGSAVIESGSTTATVFQVIGDSSCLTVTSSCPFADPKLDAALKGHSIEGFENTSNSLCADSNSGSTVSVNSCSGSHAFYVSVANGTQLISAGAANQIYSLACPDGPQSGCTDYPGDVVYVAGNPGGQLALMPSGENFNYDWTIFAAM